jgi:hypothetical protein
MNWQLRNYTGNYEDIKCCPPEQPHVEESRFIGQNKGCLPYGYFRCKNCYMVRDMTSEEAQQVWDAQLTDRAESAERKIARCHELAVDWSCATEGEHFAHLLELVLNG